MITRRAALTGICAAAVAPAALLEVPAVDEWIVPLATNAPVSIAVRIWSKQLLAESVRPSRIEAIIQSEPT